MITTLFTIFASSFIIALSGALMPGPLLTATISESSERGFIAGPMMIAGHAILELGLVIALLAGMAPFFSSRLFLWQARWVGRSFSCGWLSECSVGFRRLPLTGKSGKND